VCAQRQSEALLAKVEEARAAAQLCSSDCDDFNVKLRGMRDLRKKTMRDLERQLHSFQTLYEETHRNCELARRRIPEVELETRVCESR
jgi:hypothetical protein